MAISERKIYPRTGDKETVYLNSVVTDPNISVGDSGKQTGVRDSLGS